MKKMGLKIVEDLGIVFIALILVVSVLPGQVMATPTHESYKININPRFINYTIPDLITNSSTVLVSPPPKVPNTTPVVMNLVTNFNVTRHGLSSPAPKSYVNGTSIAPPMPPGGWALIELEFQGKAMGLVYDSGFSFNVDNNTLLWGSSPEYGTWTVYYNLTIYESLFVGKFFWQWNSLGAIINGTFLSNITLYFYPSSQSYRAQNEPNLIIPVLPTMTSGGWHITPNTPKVQNTVTIPSNVTQAILQVWAYGFSYDEFWYSNEPSFRTIIIGVDGTNISSILPFPYINTGGIYLFSWRPITGVFTMHDRFYMENMTPYLGMIEGTHTWSFYMPVRMQGWSISASLLLYTSNNISKAIQISHSFDMQNVTTVQSGTPYVSNVSIYDQYDNITYSGVSQYTINGANITSSISASETFVNLQYITPVWENISGYELTKIITTTSGYNHGITWQYSTSTKIYYPLSMDTYFSIEITQTTNGGYPMYGLADFGLTNLVQGWIETVSSPLGTNVMEDIVYSNDAFAITNLTLISPTAGYLGQIYSASGFTWKVYVSVFLGCYYSHYEHYIIAGSLDLTPPNYIQPIWTNYISQYNYY